jgi:hypothetical protein
MLNDDETVSGNGTYFTYADDSTPWAIVAEQSTSYSGSITINPIRK